MRDFMVRVVANRQPVIAVVAVLTLALAAAVHGWGGDTERVLQSGLLLGGVPLLVELLTKILRGEWGADLLAGISMVTAFLLGENLAGVLVVLMLSGGETLEGYAVAKASSVLHELAGRMPTISHRATAQGLVDVPIAEVAVNDELVVLPHEICPADGEVVAGRGSMDESYLTGEPYRIAKTPGSTCFSGAMNGEASLTIRVTRLPVDSRYSQILRVMRDSQQQRPQLRRLGDELGAWYTPLALVVAAVAGLLSGEWRRFLAVLVTATPCPLLIAIPVAIIGAISLAARRGIIIRDPAILEQIDRCRVMIFDKTGTLTYGEPRLTDVLPAHGMEEGELLRQTASLEQYSRHPLAEPTRNAAAERKLVLQPAAAVEEKPGAGLVGLVDGRRVEVTSRKAWLKRNPSASAALPPMVGGLECVVVVNNEYAGTLRYRDEPRGDGALFLKHLGPRHRITRLMLVSGDRASEVEYLAKQVGITEVYAEQSPEQKLAIVLRETALQPTLFLGDGINDAPALTAATVGLAMGQRSEVTTEAAGAVILETSLTKVDELMHLGQRMRRIALQSAVGGIAASLLAMVAAGCGWLAPTGGAVVQELIDVVAVLNALRTASLPRVLSDVPKGE